MKRVLILISALAVLAADGAAGVVFTSPLETWDGSETSISVRLFRNAVASAYPDLKTFPGTMAQVTYFDTYTVVSSPAAFAWLITPLVEDTYSFFSIYTTSFTSSNLATNYLGDQGSSAITAQFSVPVAPSTTYVVVANSVSGAAALGHSYQFEIQEIPEPGTVWLAGIAAAALLVGRARRRRA